MADVKAVKSGNWSDPTLWNTGTLPGINDNVFSNTFTVTINQNVQVNSIQNSANSSISAVAGGTFSISTSGLTVQATNMYAFNTILITVTATGITNIVGNLYGGSGTSSYCLYFVTAGTLNITGNSTGGSANVTHGVYHNGSGVINHTGNCIGGLSINNAFGANLAASGVYNLIGNVLAHTTSQAPGISISSISTLNMTGNVYAASNAAGLTNYGGTFNLNGAGICSNSSGFMPIYGQVKFGTSVSPSFQILKTNNSTLTLQDISNVAGMVPATADVRQGVVYNLGTSTGTLKVPAPSAVAFGVLTDNTTGTAILTASDFLNEIENSTHSLAVRLRNVATVQTTIEQLETSLNN